MEIEPKSYGEALSRTNDPETSSEAAESIRGEQAGKLEKLVFDALVALGGRGTAWDVELHLRENGIEKDSNSITPRFARMAEKGLVYKTSMRRPGQTGRPREVWAVCEDDTTETVKRLRRSRRAIKLDFKRAEALARHINDTLFGHGTRGESESRVVVFTTDYPNVSIPLGSEKINEPCVSRVDVRRAFDRSLVNLIVLQAINKFIQDGK